MFADGVKLFLETGKGAHSFFSHIPCLIQGLCCLVLETKDVQQPVDHSLVYFIGDPPVVADSAFTAALEEMNLGQVFETHLGMAAHILGLNLATPVFDGIEIAVHPLEEQQ